MPGYQAGRESLDRGAQNRGQNNSEPFGGEADLKFFARDRVAPESRLSEPVSRVINSAHYRRCENGRQT